MVRKSIEDIVAKAKSVAALSKTSRIAVAAVESVSKQDSGIEPADLMANRAFLVNVVVDDSDSMRGFEPVVQKAFDQLKTELQDAADEATGQCEILIQVTLLNGGLLQPYARVEDCVSLTDHNYRCYNGTPLFTRTFESLGMIIRKVAEGSDEGLTPPQTFTCLITDGDANDSRCDHIENPRSAGDCEEIISDLTATKQHIVCGVSIGGGANSTFRSIGINPRWMLDPAKDDYQFTAAIKQVSRASRSASRSAGEFQQVAEQGFEDFGGHR